MFSVRVGGPGGGGGAPGLIIVLDEKYWEKSWESRGFSVTLILSLSILIVLSFSFNSDSTEVILV